jgi:uncharacterized protein YdbL (DUF1318 family)
VSFFAFILISGFLQAESIDDLKLKIKERKPHIDLMLKTHVLGENNEGYLSARQELTKDQRRWLKDENRDRSKLYDKVAAETGYYVSKDEIAFQRARNIRMNASGGIWVQSKYGEWRLME